MAIDHAQIAPGGLKLLAPNELAELLNISKTTVYRLVERRAIRFYKIAGCLRFDLKDVEAYLQSGCVEPIAKR